MDPAELTVLTVLDMPSQRHPDRRYWWTVDDVHRNIPGVEPAELAVRIKTLAARGLVYTRKRDRRFTITSAGQANLGLTRPHPLICGPDQDLV